MNLTLSLIVALVIGLGTLNLNGSYTTDFGDLALKHKGATVTGTYSYPGAGGVDAKGSLNGTLKGMVVTFTWQQTQGAQKAGGSGKFTFAANGKSFKGTWKDSKGKTGEWSGTKK